MSGHVSSFGEVLKRLRTAAALSQEDLAERAGLSLRGISDLERGVRRAPHLDTVRRIADALALSADDRVALLTAARPPSQAARVLPNALSHGARLPHLLTPLVGREVELAALRALLSQKDVRLVTVTGPGGIGKTRLAIEVATTMVDTFADGVVYVDITPEAEPSTVVPLIASAFSIYEPRDQRLIERLRDDVGNMHLLLLLDNCDKVLGAASDIAAILGSCSRLSILATSREAFHLRGEQGFPLGPLPIPALDRSMPVGELEQNPSVALFSMRAMASDPTFSLTKENAGPVAAICRRVDGLPLAIELAAARVRMLPPPALLIRLEKRLPLLTGGARDAPARQRTMRDTIGWGYSLLSPEEQTVFRRLGVLVGGWTIEAAEAVVNFDGAVDVQQGIASLIDKSLVRLLTSGPQPRYGMLETIREFAVEQLAGTADEPRAREAHVRYMLSLAAGTWWAFPERANVQDAREWLAQVLTQPDHASQEMRALALASAALAAFNQHDFETAVSLAEASLDLSRAGGLNHHAGLALYVLTVVRQEQADYAMSLAFAEAAISHFRRSGDERWLSQALLDAGTSASLLGDVERARVLREEGIALCKKTGNLASLAQTINDLGIEAEQRGDMETALALYRESLALMIEIQERVYIAHPLASVAGVLLAAGHVELATRLLGAVASAHETNRTFPWNTERERDERTLSQARTALGEARFDVEFAAGRRLSISDAACQALAAANQL